MQLYSDACTHALQVAHIFPRCAPEMLHAFKATCPLKQEERMAIQNLYISLNVFGGDALPSKET